MANFKSIALLLMAFGLCHCSREADLEFSQAAPFDTGCTPASPSFSLAHAGNSLDLVYADRNSSALLLAEVLVPASSGSAFVPGLTSYLDRINDPPGTDSLSETHLLVTEGQDRHLFYLARRADERVLLKYVHWGPEGGNGTVDILPFIGRPLAAFQGEDGLLEVVLETGRELYRLPLKPAAAAEILASPFVSKGAASVLDGQGVEGFTVFDSLSRSLFLFRRNANSVDRMAVARFGEVHSSAVADDGTVQILAFDQRHSRIVVFRQDRPGADFHNQPLCPGRDVRCLATFFYRGSPFYLFSEQTDPRAKKDPYQFSLLAPELGGRTLRYHRLILQRGPRPFPFFRAVRAGDSLYVAFFDGSIQLLRLELVDYLRNDSD
jgi:hypothetical protein